MLPPPYYTFKANTILATSEKETKKAVKDLPKSMIFISSGLGGIFGWCVIHPFNTIAVRSNLASAHGQTFSLKVMLQQQGFWSLYDGLSAGIMRQVFYATARFGLFEIFRDKLHEYRGQTDFASRYVPLGVSGTWITAQIHSWAYLWEKKQFSLILLVLFFVSAVLSSVP